MIRHDPEREERIKAEKERADTRQNTAKKDIEKFINSQWLAAEVEWDKTIYTSARDAYHEYSSALGFYSSAAREYSVETHYTEGRFFLEKEFKYIGR